MYVYKITNLINKKNYVGQTISEIKYRWNSHKKYARKLKRKYPIYLAMNKYGIENFKIEEIEKCNSIEELNEREVFWIQELNSHVPNGYNIKMGGRNGKHSEETKQKIREKRKNQVFSEEARKRMSESGKNKIFTDEHKKHLSERQMGKKLSKETKRKLSFIHNKPVMQYDLQMNFIQEYKSVMIARKQTNSYHISECCNDKVKTSGGFIWKYKNNVT